LTIPLYPWKNDSQQFPTVRSKFPSKENEMKSAVAIAVLMISSTLAQAGECKVEGVHICCRACVVAIGEALTDVEGVSDGAADADAGTVTFQATDAEAANRGLAALGEAGFFGSASHGDDEVAFPASGAEEDEKADSVVISNLHNCCPGCKNAIDAALETVDGVSGNTWDGDAKLLTVTGSDFELTAVIAALNESGFGGTIKREE
jgi:copper chaperone CopZ